MHDTKAITPKAQQFIASVLQTSPKLAAFDCDGTLWDVDSGERFFDWEIRRGVVSELVAKSVRARYAEYKAGKVSEDDMCGKMVTLHAGLREDDLQNLAEEFFEENIAPQVFPEMRELVALLLEKRCELWAVSSTNEWVIRAAAKHFGISGSNVLAAAVEIDGGIMTDQLTRVPSGHGKAVAIRDVVKRIPDAVFGNSRWDLDMLEIARHPYAVNPNSDLAEIARKRGWTIYYPELPSAIS